jgi:hypothetical protein
MHPAIPPEEPGALGIEVARRVLFLPLDIDRFLDERTDEAEFDLEA